MITLVNFELYSHVLKTEHTGNKTSKTHSLFSNETIFWVTEAKSVSVKDIEIFKQIDASQNGKKLADN